MDLVDFHVNFCAVTVPVRVTFDHSCSLPCAGERRASIIPLRMPTLLILNLQFNGHYAIFLFKNLNLRLVVC